ncbi:MAG: hypothetical protein GYA55_13540 [SAR324 cluster bacterium]|uniref:Uncharacterized protein n=1 Tax=SAR324 cluster bacterium TaxID=2024889 RepID=A0A7X9ILF4_9DELT|nr:hypothetical protein [SAR324 cluster bacterium]
MSEELTNIIETDGTLSLDDANALVLKYQAWAESIAKAVARAWGMDWKLDGLDGAALEALIFCSRRFQPARGVPFKGYARKRIHEAATEQARKSRGWRRGLNSAEELDRKAREISAELLNIFPELRVGEVPNYEDGNNNEGTLRGSIRQLLLGASLIAVKQGLESAQPDELADYKKILETLATLDPIHQELLWKVYWEGSSLRNVAAEWDTDGLNVIREHKSILEYLQKNIAEGKRFTNKPRVRPGLKKKAKDWHAGGPASRFSSFLKEGLAHDKKNW